MKAATRLAVLVAALVTPALAFAAGPEVLNLRDGVPKELLGKMLTIAWGLFAFSLVLGLLLEAFGGAPDQPKNYGGVAWRALVVVALLGAYPKLFGTIITTAESIAQRVAPQEIWDAFNRHTMESVEAFARKQAPPASPSTEGSATVADKAGEWIEGLKPSAAYVTAFVGGGFFDTFVAFFVTAAQGFQWAFFQFSRILLALFYVLGPLALVFHIPASSQTAGRWFRAFVTITTWPIFSSLLLALATALMYRTNDAAVTGAYATAFGALASSFLLVCLNLAVPLLASAIVGGSVRNILLPAAGAAVFGATRAAGALAPMLQPNPALARGVASVGASASSAGQALATELREAAIPSPLPSPLGLPALQHSALAVAGETGAGKSGSAGPGNAPASAVPLSSGMQHPPSPPGLGVAAPANPPPVSPPPTVGADVTVSGRGRTVQKSGLHRLRLPRPPGLSTKDMTVPGPTRQDSSIPETPTPPSRPEDA